MNEEINRIKEVLIKDNVVYLTKQCKQEYIVYAFFLDPIRLKIFLQRKRHYKNRNLEKLGKSKETKTDISLAFFLDYTCYDLINRGYKLEIFNKINFNKGEND